MIFTLLENTYQKRLSAVQTRANREIIRSFQQTINQVEAAAGRPELKRFTAGQSIASYPRVQKELNKSIKSFEIQLNYILTRGVVDGWKTGNLKNNELVHFYTKGMNLGKELKSKYGQTNTGALNNFLYNKRGGKTITDRVGKISQRFAAELKEKVESGLAAGHSPSKIAASLRQTLKAKDPKQRFVAYNGARRLSNAEAYMAYRESDWQRMNQLDFILGFQVVLGQYHPKRDICDDLKGNYPKDFRFWGWHVNCYCQVLPIYAMQDNFQNWLNGTENLRGMVTDVPFGFKTWLANNEAKVAQMETKPFFVSNNQQYLTAATI